MFHLKILHVNINKFLWKMAAFSKPNNLRDE